VADFVALVTVTSITIVCFFLGRLLEVKKVKFAIIFGLTISVVSAFILFPALSAFQSILNYRMPSGDNSLVFLNYLLPGPIIFSLAIWFGGNTRTET
jgi:hypothetical protein